MNTSTCQTRTPIQSALAAAESAARDNRMPWMAIALHVLQWAQAQEETGEGRGAVMALAKFMKEWMDSKSGFGSDYFGGGE